MFQLLTQLFGGEPVFVPLRNYVIDLDAVAAAIDEDVKLIFLCNPNNPTGTIVTHRQMTKFLQRVPPGVVTVCDEAYMEFADDPAFPYMEAFVEEGYAVLVTRTFSKLHGLASLRIGYGFGRQDLIALVRQRQMPFNSGRLAYLAAAAALDDEEHIDDTLGMVRDGRQFFYRELGKMGISYLPTQGNFILLADLPLDANVICDEIMKQGVVLRPTGQFGLPDGIRITFACQTDNERIVETLTDILA
jgi:histidinol-phosphate aminotransferase